MRARDQICGTGGRRPGRSTSRPPEHGLLALQRLAGNRATTAVLARNGDPTRPRLRPPAEVPETELEDRPVAVALRKRGARPDESGPAVLRLQSLMNSPPLFSDRLAVDGVYGAKTREAVKRMEAAYGLSQTGVATPSVARVIENHAFHGHAGARGLRLSDVWVGHEALRHVDQKTLTAKLGLLSAMQNLLRLIALDEMNDSFPGAELDYWHGVAEHANGNADRARRFYEGVLAQDEAGWRGVHENARIQLERVAGRRGPTDSIFEDPRLRDPHH